MLKQVENMIVAGRQIQDYNFRTENMTHKGEVDYLLRCMIQVQCLMHPDSDEFDTLDFYIGDVLEPMMNHLRAIDKEYFPKEYIAQILKNREDFANSELGKAILGEQG